MFNHMFANALKSGEIVVEKTGPVKLFHNTKLKAEIALQKINVEDLHDKYRYLADEAGRETVEGVHKRRLLERNPALAKLIERVDKENPDDDNEQRANVGAVYVSNELMTSDGIDRITRDLSDSTTVVVDPEIARNPPEHKRTPEKRLNVDEITRYMTSIKKYLNKLQDNMPEQIPTTIIPRDPIYQEWKKSENRKMGILDCGYTDEEDDEE